MQRPLREIIEDFDASVPLAEARTIPGTWYTDPRVLDIEQRTVFSDNWLFAGRVEQVAQPGQYITVEIGGEPIAVVRGSDGVLRAFFNVCRHHAAAVLTEPAGCAERLRCPYHGWTYGLDGALKAAPEFDGVEKFDRANHGLVPVHVDTWEKFVFVCMNADPPPLSRFLGELVLQLQPLVLGALTFCERRAFTLECNWKVFVDNYLDGGYHVPHLHKGLSTILDYKQYTIETFERFCLQASPIGAGEGMVSEVRRGRALYYWLYPNFMLNWYEGYLDTNWVIPLAPDRTRVVFDFYFADMSERARAKNQQSMDVSQRIQDEDHAICESVQRGLRSRAYRAGRLSVRREAGENFFHRLLASDLRRAPG